MSDQDELKRRVLDCVGRASAQGELAPEDLEELHRLVDGIAGHSPYVPGERQDILAGNWQTAFASFGAKHSAGKARVQDSDLAVQSFNHLPSAPIRVTDILQEIDPPTAGYSNVIRFSAPDGSAGGVLIIHGAYEVDSARPERFHIAFGRAELRPTGAASLDMLSAALGLPAGASLDVAFKPPKLYSDILYLDETLRINRGNFGGLYVVERSDEPMVSVPDAGSSG